MHTTVYSGTVVGVSGLVIEAEIDISRGIPAFSIVGLPNTAVRESRERVTAAIKNSGWEFPLERITVNLAPADVRKEGAAFDLAIALGILAASQQVPSSSASREHSGRTVVLGELALDGGVRKVPGVLPILLHARDRGYDRALIPADNFDEAMVVSGLEVWACNRLSDAVGVAFPRQNGVDTGAAPVGHKPHALTAVPAAGDPVAPHAFDMSEVCGQESAKRALLVAAAGGHHILMVGPPGAGKTMLARRFVSLLPPLGERASLETTKIYSIVGLLDGRGLITTSPFRSPHHSASDAGLIGGGGVPRPGEVTLAHNGVLFLDELTEFKRHVLETLREPLEEGRITISRARCAVTFPARFQLIAAMNPCPCGYLGSNDFQCRCGPVQIERYLGKISGPLLDRISIHITVRPVDAQALREFRGGESSEKMRLLAATAREIQSRRFCIDGGGSPEGGGSNGVLNASIPEAAFRRFCAMTSEAEELLYSAQKRLRISARGRAHVVRVARTIADLEAAGDITVDHVGEAIQYRIRELPVYGSGLKV